MAHRSIVELDTEFGKQSYVRIEEGQGKLPKVVLQSKIGAKLEVYLNGAHVTSFKGSDGQELIFMSTKAIFQQGKAVRGGIPICWPQFGPGELVQHGFARTSQWIIADSRVTDGGNSVSVTLLLADSEETRKLWPHSFVTELMLTILGEKLLMELRVTNKNKEKSFAFTTALHTYFKVQSIHSTSIHELKGITYIDKVSGGKKIEEMTDSVTLSGETDRVYLNVPRDVKISDKKREILLIRKNFPDCVVWNLWAEKAKAMADMGDDDWLEFVCVESAAVGEPVSLKPGEKWIGTQEISRL